MYQSTNSSVKNLNKSINVTLTATNDKDAVMRQEKNQNSMSSIEQSTFGVGRDAYKNVVSHTKQNYDPFDHTIPGPGSYQANPYKDIGDGNTYTVGNEKKKESKFISKVFYICVL